MDVVASEDVVHERRFALHDSGDMCYQLRHRRVNALGLDGVPRFKPRTGIHAPDGFTERLEGIVPVSMQMPPTDR